ncbi:serine/arginine-rich SC35-like splicing factor SCL30 isoform X1 [Helianthus annuus]|uniref:serine/arginine-rich SC35-like splicing factor SCL30 isoform X1 n=1 Tax=Helianthus annuus TaxID=4232 RepID=UPI000B8FED18|nr:serine/arginine-rich SC35-like splicing factor SCL30 isoform X1 [Helianthus annuus]
MRRYSPAYHSPPRRHGGRPRSPPPRRGYGGGERGRPKDQNQGSLLVRNIPLNCRPEELRVPFERFGVVRDVYLPKNYYTGKSGSVLQQNRKKSKNVLVLDNIDFKFKSLQENSRFLKLPICHSYLIVKEKREPRGFAFVQFVDPYDAVEAQYHMNERMFAGREISVVLASDTRKRPEEMRRRARVRGPSGHEGRRSYHGGRSRSRSRSRSPRRPSGSRSRHRSRSYSPAPKRRRDYSPSPVRRAPRSPRDSRDYDGADDQNGDRRIPHESDGGNTRYRSSPGGASRSPSGSRSRSADIASPRDKGYTSPS